MINYYLKMRAELIHLSGEIFPLPSSVYCCTDEEIKIATIKTVDRIIEIYSERIKIKEEIENGL